MGIIDSIKTDVKKSGQNKNKIFYIREGQKARIRFLQDMDEGLEVLFHDSFESGINIPCREIFGDQCPYDDPDEAESLGIRTRSNYIWSVWNYDTKEVQLFMFKVNNCSPVPALLALYETYGTITDRDYIISVQGKQTNKTYSVVPMDKVKFRNEKAKPFSESQVYKILDKAYPYDGEESNNPDDYENEEPEDDYETKPAKTLYNECMKRGLDVKPKKSVNYYVNILREDDKATDDWGDDDGEEWDD